MPYYQWRGVNLQAKIAKGKTFAQSERHLADILFRKELALTHASQIPSSRYIFTSISRSKRADLFRQLATLLESNILLTDALFLIAAQIKQSYLQYIIHVIADEVSQGKRFSEVLKQYPILIDPLLLSLINAGEASGHLDTALRSIALFLEREAFVTKKIERALFLPIITLICFVAVASFMFTMIIPRFATVFAQAKVPITGITHILFLISNTITPYLIASIAIILTLIALLFYKCTHYERISRIFFYIMLRTPIIGTILTYRFCSIFFSGLSLLIHYTVPLDDALSFLGLSPKLRIGSSEIRTILQKVRAGVKLSDAFIQVSSPLFEYHMNTLIAIGEEANKLPFMLEKISLLYQEKLDKYIDQIIILLQPALMLILGILVAIIVFALYTPLLNFSLHITT